MRVTLHASPYQVVKREGGSAVVIEAIAPVYARVLAAQVLGSLSAPVAAALLVTPKVDLFTALSGSITPDSTTSQFTAATFTGYAQQAAVFAAGPFNSRNERFRVLTVTVTFSAGSITPPGQTILGYWISNGTTTLYAAEQFVTPWIVGVSTDFLVLNLQLGVDMFQSFAV
jgi:hypothetical protein